MESYYLAKENASGKARWGILNDEQRTLTLRIIRVRLLRASQ